MDTDTPQYGRTLTERISVVRKRTVTFVPKSEAQTCNRILLRFIFYLLKILDKAVLMRNQV